MNSGSIVFRNLFVSRLFQSDLFLGPERKRRLLKGDSATEMSKGRVAKENEKAAVCMYTLALWDVLLISHDFFKYEWKKESDRCYLVDLR